LEATRGNDSPSPDPSSGGAKHRGRKFRSKGNNPPQASLRTGKPMKSKENTATERKDEKGA